MANVIHANHSQALAQHQANLMASLAHRLEIARASHNSQLIELLEQERRQITFNAPQTRRSQQGWLKSLIKDFVRLFSGNSELQVEQFVNGSDQWWYAFDPRTGDCVYADSEAELRLWIKENYQGK
jgi:hypothetical protein